MLSQPKNSTNTTVTSTKTQNEKRGLDVVSESRQLKIVIINHDANHTYIGKAPIGSATSEAVWQIMHIHKQTGSLPHWTYILYANGEESYNNVLDDYASLTYL
jgi:hypothetical protein